MFHHTEQSIRFITVIDQVSQAGIVTLQTPEISFSLKNGKSSTSHLKEKPEKCINMNVQKKMMTFVCILNTTCISVEYQFLGLPLTSHCRLRNDVSCLCSWCSTQQNSFWFRCKRKPKFLLSKVFVCRRHDLLFQLLKDQHKAGLVHMDLKLISLV